MDRGRQETLERLVRVQVVAQVHLARSRDFLLAFEQHFSPLCHPAAGSRNGEQHGENRDRKAHRLLDQAGIKIDVRIEFARNKVVVFEGDALSFERDVQQGIAAHNFKDAVGWGESELPAELKCCISWLNPHPSQKREECGTRKITSFQKAVLPARIRNMIFCFRFGLE
jgi:hypothetical protein